MGKHSSKLKAGDSKRLIELISSGNKSSVEDFFTAKGISINTELHVYSYFRTFPLHVAVDTEQEIYHHDLVEYFISKGADLNVLDTRSGYAPLHYAAINVNGTAARALLEAGAEVNLLCRHSGQCPLHIVFTDHDLQEPLHKSTDKSVSVVAIDLVKLLLSHGADCNLLDYSGKSPLHYAVKLDDITSASLLLDAGANVNIRLVNSTPLIFHAISVSMLKLLLSWNADAEAEATNPYGRKLSLLQWSLTRFECDIVNYLVSEMPVLLHWKGVNMSPLAAAVDTLISAGQYIPQIGENIRLMIKAGCDPLTEVLERQEWDRYNNNDLYDRFLVRDPSVVELFKSMEQITSAPRSLLNVCTIRIRGILEKNISSVVEFLPLPVNLKHALTLAR